VKKLYILNISGDIMKKFSVLFFFLIFFTPLSFGQYLERFEALNDVNIQDYARPFVNTFGLSMNSGGFYSASIPSIFGFSIGVRGMYILIPEESKTYTPTLSPGYSPGEVATIYGHKGGYFAGPNGYQVTPPGLNKSAVPMAYPQATVSLLGTEVLLRYLPDVKFSDEHDINMLGVGVRHSITQYIPMSPVDVAVQILYNRFEVSNLMESSNLAFNIHASKSFVVFTPYIGLQYESTSLDIDYTYKPDPDLGLSDQRLNVTIDGDNAFRGVIGASLDFVFLVFNFDVSLSTQTVLTGGLTFAF
jgi:hypothetical protein